MMVSKFITLPKSSHLDEQPPVSFAALVALLVKIDLWVFPEVTGNHAELSSPTAAAPTPMTTTINIILVLLSCSVL